MKSKANLLNIIFFLTVILIYAYIFNRNNQLYLLNPPDEFSFKLLIQLTDIKNFSFSSPFFVLFYKIIFIFDENFYSIAKVINIILFFLGNFIIYIIARKLSNINYAKLIFLISSISTYNFYTTALMPEILFYTYFYFFVYCYLFIKNINIKYITSGINIFILFCIKGTGLFILPALIINEIFLFIKRKNKLYFLIKNVSIILIIFSILFFIFKFFFINSSDALFGSKYENVFKKISNFDELILIISIFLKNYLGHLYYFFFIFGLPFLLIFSRLFSRLKKCNLIEFFPLIIIICLSIFSSLNHAMYVFTYPNDLDVHRLNTRYYDFILPLILLSIISIKNDLFTENKTFKFLIFFISIILFFWIIITQIEDFRPTFVIFDGILFRGYVYNNIFFNIFVCINISLIIFYLLFKNKLINIYTFVYIPFIILLSSIPVSKEIKTYYKPNAYDLIGNQIQNKQKLKNKDLTVIGNNIVGEDYRVLFRLNPKEVINSSVSNINKLIQNNSNIFLINYKKNIKNKNYESFMNGRYIYIQ